jgi:hypothetical protein
LFVLSVPPPLKLKTNCVLVAETGLLLADQFVALLQEPGDDPPTHVYCACASGAASARQDITENRANAVAIVNGQLFMGQRSGGGRLPILVTLFALIAIAK